MKKEILILGGGTFNFIRNHLALAAPAYGATAKKLNQMIPDSKLVLTKMADPNSILETNDDVKKFLEKEIANPKLGVIVMNVAVCDFEAQIGEVPSGKYAKRLKTAEGNVNVDLKPSDKLLKMIRQKRPDIFLVGFKTTTGATEDEQFLTALKMMKSVKCNLVLANDVVTRTNMVITAEETIYGQSTDRDKTLKELVEMLLMRMNGTYNRTNMVDSENTPILKTPQKFQDVIKFLIDNKGFLENNGNGFTPGHFCFRDSLTSMISSQRKANHNQVFDVGMTLVKVDEEGKFTAYGKKPASVGARSQWILLNAFPEYDCIIHTHNPLINVDSLSTVDQRPFQCGSLECGMNTLTGIKDYDGIKAVFLNKHGANILFKSTDDPQKVIDFVKKHLQLGVKAK